MKLILDYSVQTIINNDAILSYPDECCGFLYGKENGVRHITHAVDVNNSKEGNKKRRFEISPLAYMKAEKFALENKLQLLGVYHSHPDHPAIASVHDLAKALPYFSYVIVSVTDKKILDYKSWKLHDEQRAFYEEELSLSKK